MTKNALHVFVHQNRHGVHELLGLEKNIIKNVTDKVDEIVETSTNPSDGKISILVYNLLVY